MTKEYENPWLFNGIPFEDPSTHYGFVYLIETPTGQRYIGRKYFWSIRKTKGKARRQRKESDWKGYYGSSDTLKNLVKEHGKSNFKRIILSLHKTAGDCNYEEVKRQFIHNVLEDDNYLNDNISGKYHRKPKHIIEDRIYNDEYRI